MTTTVAIIAPGAMGAGIGGLLVENDARVVTDLDGRGAASRRRAGAAGMESVSIESVARADIVLSIVPPAAAVPVAQRLAPAVRDAGSSPVFIDCNAVSPATMTRVAEALAGTRSRVVDGCIIGAPPMPGGRSPALYVSGDPDALADPLARHGIALHRMAAPLGAASGLKLSYAGITKGLTALGAAMLGAAEREGLGLALDAELERSQPELRLRFTKALPDMRPKAYRWVAEMREIAAFLGPDDPAAMIFEGMARLYHSLALEPGRLDAILECPAEPRASEDRDEGYAARHQDASHDAP